MLQRLRQLLTRAPRHEPPRQQRPALLGHGADAIIDKTPFGGRPTYPTAEMRQMRLEQARIVHPEGLHDIELREVRGTVLKAALRAYWISRDEARSAGRKVPARIFTGRPVAKVLPMTRRRRHAL